MLKIAVASMNAHKVKELSQMIDLEEIELVSLRDLGFEGDIVEDGATFEENALIKAKFVCEKYGIPAIADDSGLCVDALSGAPGIYSARYASTDGHNATDEENVEKLLGELKGLPAEKRTARFMCAMALVLPDGRTTGVVGKCEGIITEKVHGNGGFGYDPVFFVEQFGKTFGETTEEEKKSVSHRCNAVKLMKKELSEIFSV